MRRIAISNMSLREAKSFLSIRLHKGIEDDITVCLRGRVAELEIEEQEGVYQSLKQKMSNLFTSK